MFDAQQKSTGTGYTTTVALLAMAFIFIPSVLILSRPFGNVALAVAIGCSAICAMAAWVNWKKSSQLSIPSIAIQKVKAK